MPKFKFPFQDLETIPKLIKDFLQQEIPQFSAYQFTLENALLQAEKKAKNIIKEEEKKQKQKELRKNGQGDFSNAK
jgi:hypothetical protein